MKRSLIITLVLVFIFSIAATAFATNRAFDDVPLSDWSYGAVNKLLQAGVIDSYDDKTFKGEKIVTRYEMALVVRRAIAKSEKNDKTDIETKALITKMAAEYGNELKDLGVGIAAQPAPQINKANAIDWTGSNFRIRYDHKSTTTTSTVTATSLSRDFNYNFELIGHAQFAPGWMAEVRMEGNKNSSGVDEPAADNLSGQFDIEQMFVTGPVGQGSLLVGRFKNAPVFALVNKEFGEGVRYSFGKVVKTNITWAKNDSKYTYVNSNTVTSSAASPAGESSLNPGYGTNVGTIDFKYSLDKTTDLFAAFYYTNSFNRNYKTGRIWEGAFAKKLTPDVTLRGDYAQSNRSSNNHALYASLSYKKADIATVGSYGWILEGVRNEAEATIKTDPDIKDFAYDSTKTGLLTNSGENLSSITNGQKGFDVVYQYVPVKNTKFTGRYLYAKPINGNSYHNKTQVRLQLEVFF